VNNLIYHGIAKLLLAGKVMEERALGDAGGFHNLVQTPSLKTVSVELGERGHEYPLPHRPCSLSLGLNHENKIQTSRYVCQALNLKTFLPTSFGRGGFYSGSLRLKIRLMSD
jgi:hypothetical protein